MEEGKRLAHYVDKQGFTKKKFCEQFSFDYNNMVTIMAGKRSIGIKVLNQIHWALPKLNVHWLLYGEGPIELNTTAETIFNEPAEEYKLQKDAFEYMLLKYLDNNNIKNKIYELIQNHVGKK